MTIEKRKRPILKGENAKKFINNEKEVNKKLKEYVEEKRKKLQK